MRMFVCYLPLTFDQDGDLVALHAAIGHMGISPTAAMLITNVQGMDTLNEFHLTDDNGIYNLYRAVQCPGGQPANPAFVAAGGAAAAGFPMQIANPGFVVSTQGEVNLKLMCYLLCYCQYTSHVTVATDTILDDVHNIKDHKDWEVTHTDVEPPEINEKDWAHTFEAIDKCLCGCLGENFKLPLTYVVHDNEAVTPDPVAPATWPSKIDEMISHAPHRTATFLGDNVKVWEKISTLTYSHEC